MIPKVGQQASMSREITMEDIQMFAQLVGDQNPVHLDKDYAKKTRFRKRIAHGMIGASLISAVLGAKLPGSGTIYLSQTLRFTAPVFPGDTIKARVTVMEVKREKTIVTLETVCTNQRGDVVLEGEALVLVEEIESNEG